MNFSELFIGAIILWIAAYIVGRILLKEKSKINIFKLIITISIFSVMLAFVNSIDSEILHGTIKIIYIYTLISCFYKVIFKETISKCMLLALIWYLCLFTSEVIIALLASYILKDSLLFLKNTIIINSIITALNLIIINISKNKLVSLVKNSSLSEKGSLVIVTTILITLALLVFRIPLDEWRINVEFVITMLILLCFCLIGFYLLKQKADIQKTTSMYQQLVEYSDITNGLLEDYRIVSHEHKNQLSIIRGMIDGNKEELIDYVDNLLEKREIIKYQWIGELNHLPLSGLKGLINYKLIQMESSNLNINISISKDISKTKLNKLSNKQKDNLYSIMGVYLDNAIQASKKSKKKEISLEIYKEKKNIKIILANTYSGKIELNKLDNYGYTTKGKNHGVGLHIAKKILEEDNIFYQNRSLFEDYYIQELRIDLDKIIKATVR